MNRIEAWFQHDIIDRPPVSFHAHNAEFSASRQLSGRKWPDLKARWFDAEYQVDKFIASLQGSVFHGETFPVFSPNLGPNVYAAFHGAELKYGEVTSWIERCVHDWDDIPRLKFNEENAYYQKIEELTRIALAKCPGQFLVGYTDLHTSLDCVADWRDPQMLCMDLIDAPERVRELLELADQGFLPLFDHYDALLKAHNQPSVQWMGIPARGKLHAPSCDFSTMISAEDFSRFYLPSLKSEVRHMTHNIFHLDGKGLIRHLDTIFQLPEIQAIQWVQGVGDDEPILQWIPLIKRMQSAGKSVIVDLKPHELEPFMAEVSPKGVFLWIAAGEEEQQSILKRLLSWT